MPRVNNDPRTPAHFRALRTVLGISRRDLADLLDVHIRSARAWDYTTTAPDAAWAILDRQAAWVTDTLNSVEDGLDLSEAESGPAEGVDLTTYVNDASAQRAGIDMPAAWHSAGIGLLSLLLGADGYDVHVGYAPLED